MWKFPTKNHGFVEWGCEMYERMGWDHIHITNRSFKGSSNIIQQTDRPHDANHSPFPNPPFPESGRFGNDCCVFSMVAVSTRWSHGRSTIFVAPMWSTAVKGVSFFHQRCSESWGAALFFIHVGWSIKKKHPALGLAPYRNLHFLMHPTWLGNPRTEWRHR